MAEGKYIYTKMLNHDSDCVKDYHWIDNILDMKPEYDKSEFSGTLTLRERHTVSETGAAGCADASAASVSPPAESKSESSAAGSKAETKAAPNKESSKELNKDSYREAVLRVVVKRDDGINDGKIRMFATLESCKGNACDTLGGGTTVYIVEKSESGSPADFHQRAERWRQGWARRGAIQKAERKPFLGRGRMEDRSARKPPSGRGAG